MDLLSKFKLPKLDTTRSCNIFPIWWNQSILVAVPQQYIVLQYVVIGDNCCVDVPKLGCKHKETDTQTMLHLHIVLQNLELLIIYSRDTDVFVMAAYYLKTVMNWKGPGEYLNKTAMYHYMA